MATQAARPLAPESNGPIVSYWAIAAGLFCAFVLLTVDVFRASLYRVIIAPDYAAVHVVTEFASIIVSFSIFAVGWYGYKQNRNTQDLYMALGFMIIGSLDFVHTMSYQGMPGLLTTDVTSKASMYWIAARLFAAITFLIAPFVRPDSKKPWMTPRVLMPAALVTITVIVLSIAFFSPALPPLFVAGKGQTQLKVGLEYLIIILNLFAVFAFGEFSRRERRSVELLQAGLVVSMFSELSFVLYTSSPDSYNLMGHVFKAIAYYFFLRALFESSVQRPYVELVRAREDLAGLVRETAELYEQSDRQRERLEHSFDQIGSALGSSLDVNRTLDLIVDLAAEMIGAQAALVAVPNGERPVLDVRARRGLASGQVEIPLVGSLAGDAVTHRRARWATERSETTGLWLPQLTTGEVASVLAAPIVFEDTVLGVLSLYSTREHAFGPHDAELLTTFAKQAAIAVDNAARFGREWRIASSFQRRLLPALPNVPGMELAAVYEPASSTAEVGGDLYDAILLDRSRLALAVGDVSGKGLDAATIMASVQYMMRGFLFQGMQPGEILSGLHSAMSKELEPHEFVTIFLSILDLQTKELFYSNAGHPPPILITRDDVRSISGFNGGPVGVMGAGGSLGRDDASHWAISGASSYRTDRILLPDEFEVLMYTDGLIEARNGDEFFGESRVLETCETARDVTAQQLVQRLLSDARDFSEGDLNDDMALLAAKSRKPSETPPQISWDI